jgi:hypothetical protein
MVAVPEDMPVTTPEPEMEAIVRSLLLQMPPVVASVSVTTSPTHSVPGPPMGEGSALTVTGMVAMQPPGSRYEMVAEPLATPLTTPPDVTVAMPGALVLHDPPGVASERVMV